MSANDTMELGVFGTLFGQQYLHTIHFRQKPTSGLGAGNEQQLIDAWQAAAQTAWLALHHNTYTLDRIQAKQVCGAQPLRQAGEEGVGLTGTRTLTGESLAPWLSITVTEYSDLAGRSRRGRFFISGMGEVDIVGDVFISTYRTIVEAYNTALMNAFGPTGANNDFRLVVHSRKLAVPGVQCQDSSRPVDRLVLRNRLTTQRSRRARLAL